MDEPSLVGYFAAFFREEDTIKLKTLPALSLLSDSDLPDFFRLCETWMRLPLKQRRAAINFLFKRCCSPYECPSIDEALRLLREQS